MIAHDPRPASYRLVLPPQWWSIPLDEGVAERSVAALVKRQFAGIDNQPLARTAVQQRLMLDVDRSRRVGGIELYLSVFRTGAVVLPASLLVSFTPAPTQAIGLDALAEVLAVADSDYLVRSVEVLPLPSGEALRRLVFRTVVDDPAAEPVPSINLDWHLPVPAGDGAVVSLSFATSLVTLHDAFLDLFDAIASTFTWTW